MEHDPFRPGEGWWRDSYDEDDKRPLGYHPGTGFYLRGHYKLVGAAVGVVVFLIGVIVISANVSDGGPGRDLEGPRCIEIDGEYEVIAPGGIMGDGVPCPEDRLRCTEPGSDTIVFNHTGHRCEALGMVPYREDPLE